ncbi:MAG: hypothetical protein M0030_04150 [Actinomycetota bacterium]|nr:hypothetical protein [Actinomycetota bacterium]
MNRTCPTLGTISLGWQDMAVLTADDSRRPVLVRRGFMLEYLTLGWNVAGIVVLAIAAIAARSVALAGFGLDPPIEIAPPSPSSGNCRAPARNDSAAACA